MNRIATFALGCLIAVPAHAQLTSTGGPRAIEWTYVVGSPRDDWVNDLVPLANGNVLGVGFVGRDDDAPSASDWEAEAIELRLDGTPAAEKRYGKGGGVDAFWSMIEGAGNRRMFAGFTTRMGGGGIDGWAHLTTGDGSLVKERAFGGGGYDRFTDLTQADEGFVFVGHSQVPGSDVRRVYLVRTDASGEPLWERIFDGPESWGALYVEPAGDGGFLVSGGVSAPESDVDMFVLKTDSDGRELWRKRVGTAEWNEINHGLVVRPDGQIVVVGYTHARGAESNDLVAATLTSDGTVERLERFGGSKDDRAILAKLDANGRVWIVGHTASAGAGGADLLLASLDLDGAFDPGAITIGGPADDNGTALLPLDNGLLVAGYSRNFGHGGQDAFIAKVTPPAFSTAHPAFKRVVVIPAR